MRKYLFSLLIQDVSWPSTKGEIYFETMGNISVDGIPVKWTSNLKLELLLSNLSYHYSIVLENPLMGRVDVFSRSRTREIASEVDVSILLREFKVFFIHDLSASENFLPGSFVSKSIRRFSLDDWGWDSFLGGFLKEDEPSFDVELPNLTFIYASDDDWVSAMQSKINKVMIAPIATKRLKAAGLAMRTSCNLIVDDNAPRIDFRVLNMDLLNSLDYLLITYEDYIKWVDGCSVPNDIPQNTHTFLEVRKSLELARQNGKYCVNPLQLHWRTATWDQKKRFECGEPCSDWNFLIFVNACGWANMLPFSVSNINRFLGPAAGGAVLCNAIRLEKDIRGLMIRSHFVTQTAAEKMIATKFAGHNKLMQAFGLHVAAGKWSPKPSMLAIHKASNLLGSNLIDLCFDGFAKDEAHKLMSETRECPVCSTDASTSLLDQCGHVFCETCIKSHINFGGDTCPICRESLTTWTTIKRSTSRRKVEEHLSKKLYMEDMPLDDALVIVPNKKIAEVIETWIPSNVDRTALDFLPIPSKKYAQFILLTSYLRTAAEVSKLHLIFQSCAQDGTVLHVLMDDNLPPWIDDFANCYKGLVQVSVYR
jgi:hypothetical protein